MANLTGPNRAHYVQGMFTQIAARYDLMNRLMTFGQDMRWRRLVIQRARLPENGQVLDLGAGTGDLARLAAHELASYRSEPGLLPGGQIIAADFTLGMMVVGKQHTVSRHLRQSSVKLDWSAADALNLPFPNATFDAVVSAFLLRNVDDLDQCLAEQWRVLKQSGRMVALDTSPSSEGLIKPFVRFHLHTVVPILGRLISKDDQAYTYLPDSTQGFLEPGPLASRLQLAGFHQVGYQRLMFGSIAIHWGEK